MSSKSKHTEQENGYQREERYDEKAKEQAARALDLLESGTDEKDVVKAEQQAEVAAKDALDTISENVLHHSNMPTSTEEHEIRDMHEVVDAEERAQLDAAKNDLYFEDRKNIKAEEAAADAEERADEFLHPDRPVRKKILGV